MKISELEKILKYTFTNKKLIQIAITHSSYANEMDNKIEHNQRMEFLGDAVLELCISTEIYNRFEADREGQLTKKRSRLVNESSLANIAKELNLSEFILLGKGEEQQGGRYRNSLLADSFEAILGAIYLDGGFIEAQKFVHNTYMLFWSNTEEKKHTKDYKTSLQEYTQEQFRTLPYYKLVDTVGPEHAKEFKVELLISNGLKIEASGVNRKNAEQEAAKQALIILQVEKK